MKVKISTIIDVPDEVLLEGEHRFTSAIQLIFDDITNFATCQHFHEALKWCCKGEKAGENSTENMIYKHHEYWGEKLEKLDWKYEEVNSENKESENEKNYQS